MPSLRWISFFFCLICVWGKQLGFIFFLKTEREKGGEKKEKRNQDRARKKSGLRPPALICSIPNSTSTNVISAELQLNPNRSNTGKSIRQIKTDGSVSAISDSKHALPWTPAHTRYTLTASAFISNKIFMTEETQLSFISGFKHVSALKWYSPNGSPAVYIVLHLGLFQRWCKYSINLITSLYRRRLEYFYDQNTSPSRPPGESRSVV